MSTSTRDRQMVGTFGLVAFVLLLLGNLLHPFDGSTEMYGDARLFMQKMSAFWIIDHLVVAGALLVVPWVAWTWGQQLGSGRARSLGHAGWMLVLVGSAIGVVHVGGIDGVAFPAYRDVVESSTAGAAEIAGGAVLLKVHLTTFMGWLLTMWFGAQGLIGAAALADGRRRWLGGMLLAGSALGLASAIVTALAGQLTTVSEPVLFRSSTFTFTIWLLVASLDLRRSAALEGPAAADVIVVADEVPRR